MLGCYPLRQGSKEKTALDRCIARHYHCIISESPHTSDSTIQLRTEPEPGAACDPNSRILCRFQKLFAKTNNGLLAGWLGQHVVKAGVEVSIHIIG